MHWVFLLLAVLGEVLGTSWMKALVNAGHQTEGVLAAISLVGLSYVFLSRTALKIPVAIATAFWEALGMILIALVSWLWLHETISPVQALGLVVALAGIGITHYGHHLKLRQQERNG